MNMSNHQNVQVEEPAMIQNKSLDLSILLDNPIIIKQKRVRLKRSSILSWLMFVGLIASSLIWMEFQFGRQRYDRSAGYILGGMIFILLIGGTQQLGLMINAARATGMIDFHRLSPQTPLSLYIGFLLGAPIRELIIVGFSGIFLVLACVLYQTSLLGVFAILFAFLVLCLNLYGLSIVSVMLARNPNPNAAKGAAWGVFAAMGMLGPLFSGTMAINRAASEPPQIQFWGVKASVFLIFAMTGLISFAFLIIAGVRRFQDDNRPSLTKKQAITAFFFAIVTGLGILFQNDSVGTDFLIPLELGVIAFWALCSMILLATASPERVAYIGGLRRSLRLGLRRPSPLQDRALNRWALVAIALLMTTGITLMNLFRNGNYDSVQNLPSVTTATAILVVLQFGLALQYFRLRLGRHASGAMLACFIVAWVLPILMGFSVTIAGTGPELQSTGVRIMSVSPVPGIILGSGSIPRMENDIRACQLAALLPALVSVFIFNMMITNLQRRIDKRILPDHKINSGDPFAYLEHTTARELVSGNSFKTRSLSK